LEFFGIFWRPLASKICWCPIKITEFRNQIPILSWKGKFIPLSLSFSLAKTKYPPTFKFVVRILGDNVWECAQ
jgi:hypothetical protein